MTRTGHSLQQTCRDQPKIHVVNAHSNPEQSVPNTWSWSTKDKPATKASRDRRLHDDSYPKRREFSCFFPVTCAKFAGSHACANLTALLRLRRLGYTRGSLAVVGAAWRDEGRSIVGKAIAGYVCVPGDFDAVVTMEPREMEDGREGQQDFICLPKRTNAVTDR